jgi:hypothetical protein
MTTAYSNAQLEMRRFNRAQNPQGYVSTSTDSDDDAAVVLGSEVDAEVEAEAEAEAEVVSLGLDLGGLSGPGGSDETKVRACCSLPHE